MQRNINNRKWYMHIGALCVLAGTHVAVASEGKKAVSDKVISDGENQILERWPYHYWELQKEHRTIEEQQAASNRSIAFYEDLRAAADLTGSKPFPAEQKRLARSASSNELFEAFKAENGARIYGGGRFVTTLYRRSQLPDLVAISLTFDELVALRAKIRGVSCSGGGHGEQLKAEYLRDIQDNIKRLEALK